MLDLWYKNAVIYSVDVRTFMDSNGDGIGDFAGLTHRLDHISTIGANCIWLMPFYPSPDRDNGYDVSDYYGVDRRLGTPGDFVEFAREARERGIRILIDLVINHTSIDHHWFQEARKDRGSKYRGYYVWADEPPPEAREGVLFPGHQESTWTYDEAAGQYYFHRFYDHQPDLNVLNPAVWEEFERIMGYWLELGVSGFRLDAAPYLIELEYLNAPEGVRGYHLLRGLREFLQWRRGDAVLLAEANVAADEILEYFGDGTRMHMMFGFLVNQQLFLSLATGEAGPLRSILKRLPQIPAHSQWATFVRNHDELDLGRLTEREREAVFKEFAPEEGMRLYGRGIRRRLAPMLGNDRRRLELTYALLLSLPGTPVLYYGEEIGMGDDLSLPERNSVRTPMQWSDEPNGGFSEAAPERLIRPVIVEGEYGADRVNATDQSRDPRSLMNRVAQMVRLRRSTPEFGWGRYDVVECDQPSVLAHRCEWLGNAVLALHNLSGEPCEVTLRLPTRAEGEVADILSDREYAELKGGSDRIPLAGYGYRWLRLAGARR